MFNSVNNPFNRRIESSTSSDTNGQNQRQQEQKQQERHLLEEEEPDQLNLGRPIMTEDDIIYMVKDYINKLKNEKDGDEKFAQKADKWLSKFDVKKFMKRNPNITISDFHMIMFMETESLR